MMKLEEIKSQVIDNNLLEIVILMGELRNKVNAVLSREEEFEKLAGGTLPACVDEISAFLCKSEADICDLIGTVAYLRLDNLTNPMKTLSPIPVL